METRGRINAYECQTCGYVHWTVNLDDGVTPMFLRCRFRPNRDSCDGVATSRCYRVAQDVVPEWGWFRPADTDGRWKRSPWREYLQNGGLLLRKLDPMELEQFGVRFRGGYD